MHTMNWKLMGAYHGSHVMILWTHVTKQQIVVQGVVGLVFGNENSASNEDR